MPDRAEAAGCLEANQTVVDRFAGRDPDHLLWRREGLRLRYNRMEQKLKAAQRDAAPDVLEVRKEQLKTLEASLATVAEITRHDPENYFWAADVANFQRRVAETRARRHRPARREQARGCGLLILDGDPDVEAAVPDRRDAVLGQCREIAKLPQRNHSDKIN